MMHVMETMHEEEKEKCVLERTNLTNFSTALKRSPHTSCFLTKKSQKNEESRKVPRIFKLLGPVRYSHGQKVLKYSRILKSSQEFSRIFKDTQEYSRIFKNIHEYSRIFKKYSRIFKNTPEYSNIFRNTNMVFIKPHLKVLK